MLDEDKSYNSVVPAGQDVSTITTTEDPANDLPELLSPEQLSVDPVALALNYLPVPSEEQTPIISDQVSPPQPPDGDTALSNLMRHVIESDVQRKGEIGQPNGKFEKKNGNRVKQCH